MSSLGLLKDPNEESRGEAQKLKRMQCPPLRGRMKINVDAGITKEGIRLGKVVRDHYGAIVLAAYTRSYNGRC